MKKTSQRKIASKWLLTALNGKIFKRQRGLCCYCDQPVERPYRGQAIQQPNTATREHIERTADGGKRHYENYSISCFRCNAGRGGMNWLQYKSMVQGEWHPSRPDDFSKVFND